MASSESVLYLCTAELRSVLVWTPFQQSQDRRPQTGTHQTFSSSQPCLNFSLQDSHLFNTIPNSVISSACNNMGKVTSPLSHQVRCVCTDDFWGSSAVRSGKHQAHMQDDFWGSSAVHSGKRDESVLVSPRLWEHCRAQSQWVTLS